MKTKFWLFKKIDLGLKTEVIINISFLMVVAILLTGFTTYKINERNMVRERIRYGERIIKDFQSMIDFIAHERKEFSLNHPHAKKQLNDFINIYTKEKNFYDVVITDYNLEVIASLKKELIGKSYSSDFLKKSIQSGQFYNRVEKTEDFLMGQYKKIIIHSPLWIHNKINGGIEMKLPLNDLSFFLLESQKIILITLLLDAIVLIIFGSFLLSRVLIKPLKDLVQLTNKVSEGDFSKKIVVDSKNEIGQLMLSFNRMIEKIKENQESLKNYLESLESINRKLKQTQEELIRTEKLASIGRFAAGVAHEIGNPLGAILGYTTILEKEGMIQEETKDYLKRIEKEIERINRIVRELLDFARPTPFEIKEVEINDLIKKTLSLLSYQKNFKSIETRIELKTDLPMVKGDESRLTQVLMNIILNAIDAMPNGGILQIQTEEYVVENSFGDRLERPFHLRRREDPIGSDYSYLRVPNTLSHLVTKFSRRGRWVRIQITDTGVGMNKEDLEKIFDPFFTTKAPDRGTGLGLSISLRIVESLGGEIKVESELGKGSTFDIYFPSV